VTTPSREGTETAGRPDEFDLPAVVRVLEQNGYPAADVLTHLHRAQAALIPQLMPASEKVCLAYVMSDQVGYNWHHSLVQLILYDLANHNRLIGGGWIATRYGTGGLIEARNKTVEEFLQARDADWLLWLDTDMGFQPDLLDRLHAAAHPTDRPVVGALCFSFKPTHADGMGGWHSQPQPTLYRWIEEETPADPSDEGAVALAQQGFAVVHDFPPNTLVRCAGTGSAAILIHRSVFEQIQTTFGRAWYDETVNPTMHKRVSEDLSFCMRALALQIPIHVHTGAVTNHLKPAWVGPETYWEWMAGQPEPPADPQPWPAKAPDTDAADAEAAG